MRNSEFFIFMKPNTLQQQQQPDQMNDIEYAS
jgi:hypothetical protein